MAFWDTGLARARLGCLRGLATLPHVGDHPGVPYMAGFSALLLLAVVARLFESGPPSPQALVAGGLVWLGGALPLWGIVLYGAASRARISDRIRAEERINRILRTVTDGCAAAARARTWRWTVVYHANGATVQATDGRTQDSLDAMVPPEVWAALPALLARARTVDGRTALHDRYGALLIAPTDPSPSAHARLSRAQALHALLREDAIEAIDKAIDL